MSDHKAPGDPADRAEVNIAARKDAHLRVCLEEAVEPGVSGGFERYRLAYRALPELRLDDVDLSTTLAGRRLRAPLVVGAMTGGTPEAGRLNRTLARAAQRVGVGFALGSGRVVLEHPETVDTFAVRDVAPDVLLFANLGAVQLNLGVTVGDAERLCELLDADALNVHLNPLQEAIQPEGDTDFSGLAARVGQLASALARPVFVKEVGAGIGPETAKLLAGLPIAGVETAGVGGTSWAKVEALRAGGDRQAELAGLALAGLGIPTAESVVACREAMPRRPVIASGGLRTAVEMATALALGADAVATALPLLKAAAHGEEVVVELLEHYVHTLRILCFVTGARTPAELRGRVVRLGATA